MRAMRILGCGWRANPTWRDCVALLALSTVTRDFTLISSSSAPNVTCCTRRGSRKLSGSRLKPSLCPKWMASQLATWHATRTARKRRSDCLEWPRHIPVRDLARRWCRDSSRGPRSNRLYARDSRHPGTQYRRSGALSKLRIPARYPLSVGITAGSQTNSVI